MTKFRLILILIVAAGAAGFAIRYQSFREVKAEREQIALLRQPTTPSTNTVTIQSISSGLSDTQRNELLRLRGQLGVLRRELSDVTNQLTKSSPPRSLPR